MTINLTPGMRVHDIELTMPERFGAPKEAHTKPSGDAHIRHCRREPVFVTVITASAMFSAIEFDANGPKAKCFHDDTEYCDEEATLQDRTVRPRGELILCVYAERVKFWSSRP